MIKINSYSSLEALIEGIRQGETAALQAVYKKHYRMVYALVNKYNGDIHDVKDIMQETVIALYQNVVKGKYQPTAKLSTYLYRIAKNICTKRFSAKNSINELPESLADNSEYNIMYQQRQERIKACLLNELKVDCRKVLVYFYYQKMSLADIATEMGFTPEFAKNKKRRCMQYFRNIVKRQER